MNIKFNVPFLMPRKEFDSYIDEIWAMNWHTNNGKLVRSLELHISSYLSSVPGVLVSSGTSGLIIALNSLGKVGEIITTPFSYIATSSAIAWTKHKPIYVDIDGESFNINPDLIERAITHRTKAVLLTHVFGNPCDIDRIEKICCDRNIKVLYDAAHCFGVDYKDQSIFNFGDISIVSFHATKIFHTIEGGAIFSNDRNMTSSFKKVRNFGHNGPGVFDCIGINAKCSEYHAAMGLAILPYVDYLIERRKKCYINYKSLLEDNREISFQKIDSNCTRYNYAYFPILFRSEQDLLVCKSSLEKSGIETRRYFYPSLNTLDFFNPRSLSVSDGISKRILCLPLHNAIDEDQQVRITTIINKSTS